MTAVIGKNGVGKSALFDAFGFLADALKSGVEEACDARDAADLRNCGRRGKQAPSSSRCTIETCPNVRPITYEIGIEVDESGRPYVVRELMHEARENDLPLCFLMLNQGQGSGVEGNPGGSGR